MYQPDHPIWKLLRLIVLSITLCVSLGLCLAMNYKNGWSTGDLQTLLVALVTAVCAVGGYDAIKAKITS